MSIEDNLRLAGYQLISVPEPVGSYVPAVQTGNLIYTSGQIPVANGQLLPQFYGTVGGSINVDTGREAAILCTLNALAAIKSIIGDLDRIARVVKVVGYIASVERFIEQSKVMNAASDLLVEAFGDRGRHARSSVGVAALPGHACVEVEMIVEVGPTES